MLLLSNFIFDHLFRSFDIINAISAFPAGRMAVILGGILQKPVVVHLIGSEIVKMPDISFGDLLQPRLEKITRWVCGKADVLIALTEYQKKMMERNLDLKRLISVLPRRVDVKKFPFRERNISFPVQFLHIASYHPVKDQETLFRTFAKVLKSVPGRLIVIGDGFHIPSIEKMLVDLEIDKQVKFVGVVRHEELTSYFDRAHILLHTSYYESLGGVVQEAMSSGVPVCGTEVGILADLGDPFAVVAPPHDPDQLARKTLALIADRERYHRQQKHARDYIASHDSTWAAKQYRQLFDTLADKN